MKLKGSESHLMADCAQVIVDLGVPEEVARPAVCRWLWKRRVSVRPPLYPGFVASIVLPTLILGSAWGVVMRYRMPESSTGNVLSASLFYGLSMAIFFRWHRTRQRKKYRLPSWERVIERATKCTQASIRALDDLDVRSNLMIAQTYPVVNGSAVGRFFVDESCIYCELCVETAPRNFSYDSTGGFAFISAQPLTQDELDQVAEALEGCPTESIGDHENYRPNYMPGNRQ